MSQGQQQQAATAAAEPAMADAGGDEPPPPEPFGAGALAVRFTTTTPWPIHRVLAAVVGAFVCHLRFDSNTTIIAVMFWIARGCRFVVRTQLRGCWWARCLGTDARSRFVCLNALCTAYQSTRGTYPSSIANVRVPVCRTTRDQYTATHSTLDAACASCLTIHMQGTLLIHVQACVLHAPCTGQQSFQKQPTTRQQTTCSTC